MKANILKLNEITLFLVSADAGSILMINFTYEQVWREWSESGVSVSVYSGGPQSHPY